MKSYGKATLEGFEGRVLIESAVSVPMCIYHYQVNADFLSILFFVLFSTNLIRHSNKKNLSADIYEGQTMVKKYNASIFSAQ